MELQEIAYLDRGDVVKYVGPKKNKPGLVPGRLYTVKEVRPDYEEFVLEIGMRIGNSPYGLEWDVSSFERVEVSVLLEVKDFNALFDLALATNDRAWFAELHERAFQKN